MISFCAKNATAREKNQEKFLRIFGKSIFKFWDGNLLGFDVIKFDQFINPNENESTCQAVERKYGKEGVRVIKSLLYFPAN